MKFFLRPTFLFVNLLSSPSLLAVRGVKVDSIRMAWRVFVIVKIY